MDILETLKHFLWQFVIDEENNNINIYTFENIKIASFWFLNMQSLKDFIKIINLHNQSIMGSFSNDNTE